MSTIQQLKNFIRHGKQARATGNYDDAPRKHDEKPQAGSDPMFGGALAQQQALPAGVPDAFSAVDASAQNRAAQAGNVAAHAAGAGQELNTAPGGGGGAHGAAQAGKRVNDVNIAQLVAEENESKGRFPRYPGLERWDLVEKMGDGAFSNVYRARDTQGTAGEVAIKVVRKYEMNSMQGSKHLHPDFKKIPKAAERSNILKEVQIMRQLDHPNIIKLIDFSESRQYYYIILELAPGGELFHQIVRLTYFSEDLSRHVITQVAKALEYLHEERGVVHRDIKPENILFNPTPFVPSKHPKAKQPGDEDKVDEGEFIRGVGAGGIGQIKIADFGLSKIVWDKQTMTPCGTVGYTAPEIVKDERYSKSVDMWALGCVLYTLLCGFPPFYDESIEVLTEKVAKGQFTFLSPWWDDIPKSAKDLISHLLTVDPDKRYTIREFLAHPWIRQLGPTPRDEKKQSEAVLRSFNASKLQDGDRIGDFRSPGAVNLREVFDVGYAVHRQEEEAKRRKQMGLNKGGNGDGAIPRMLALNEDSEEDEEMADGDSGESNNNTSSNDSSTKAASSDEGPEYVHKPTTTQQLEQRMRDATLDQQPQSRGRERERKFPPPPAAAAAQAPAPTEKGYGQHSAAVAAAARQQVKERNRNRGAFELNLDGATLLGRRGVRGTGTRVA